MFGGVEDNTYLCLMFKWKPQSEKFKGEGIYHLTFAVNNRVPLLGELRGPVNGRAGNGGYAYGGAANGGPVNGDHSNGVPANGGHANSGFGRAYVAPTALGAFVNNAIEQLPGYYPKVQVITKCLMPDHVHMLLWTHEGEYESIKMVARGFAQGCSKEARRLHKLRKQGEGVSAQSNCAGRDIGMVDYSCGNGSNTLFGTPYVRTLVHAGQLTNMYEYIRMNPQRAWVRRMHPDLFRLRRNTVCCGLTFSSLGNHWLLEWPVRQSVVCSRSISEEDLVALENKVLWYARQGAITYSAAISKGEQRIVRKVREEGYPLVIVLKDGFPKEGSEQERYYKPGGIYFELCSEGKLLLLEAIDGTYELEDIVEETDRQLYMKCKAKGYTYTPIPHTSERWRFMAANVMVERMVEDTDRPSI